MTSTILSFKVDGVDHQVLKSPSTTLLEIMRDTLGKTGVRAGCREGGCGSCSVLIDGELALSCLVPAERLQGCSVETVASLGSDAETFHPIQEAFIKHGAIQCGFCTSGMLMAATALLKNNSNPSRDEVEVAISGNVCRCTGYAPIIDAVLDAAEQLSS